MPQPDFTLLYVDDPAVSTAFYSDVLGLTPVERSPNFALFVLDSGLRLGLWSRSQVEPTPTGSAGVCEVVFTVADADAVQAQYDDWKLRGMKIVQVPTDMDFGRTFVAEDPDGHRLRVFTPSEDR